MGAKDSTVRKLFWQPDYILIPITLKIALVYRKIPRLLRHAGVENVVTCDKAKTGKVRGYMIKPK